MSSCQAAGQTQEIIPEESKEMYSAYSTEPQPTSEREEDQQEEAVCCVAEEKNVPRFKKVENGSAVYNAGQSSEFLKPQSHLFFCPSPHQNCDGTFHSDELLSDKVSCSFGTKVKKLLFCNNTRWKNILCYMFLQYSAFLKIQRIEKKFNKYIHCKDECHLFLKVTNDVHMNDSFDKLSPDNPLCTYLKKNFKATQFGTAVLLLKNGAAVFLPIFDPSHHQNCKRTFHSEELLIPCIEVLLRDIGTDVQSITIYSYNSPCLKRQGNITPCMFLLLENALYWNIKYGIITNVVFTKFWGLDGKKYFGDLSDSKYDSYIKNTRYKLNIKTFRTRFNKHHIYERISDLEDKDLRSRLHRDITSAKKYLTEVASSSFGLFDEHLERGQTVLSQVDNKISEVLETIWKETVTEDLNTKAREEVNDDLKIRDVKFFQKKMKLVYGSESPLRLYHISEDDLK